jgi:hypothetical protein
LPSTQRRGFRNLVWFALPWQGQTINVLVTHVDRQVDRELQLRHVLALFDTLSPPALLLGDLNTTRADPVLAAFLKTSGAIDLVGPPADPGNDDRLDFFARSGTGRGRLGCQRGVGSPPRLGRGPHSRRFLRISSGGRPKPSLTHLPLLAITLPDLSLRQ